MLEVQGLAKRYGDTVALDGVDLEIEAGAVMALLGPNGAGKTTLVSIVAGLRRADRGTVHVGGALGLAPQDLGIYPALTVRENLAFFAELHGVARRDRAARVEAVAEGLDLGPLLQRPARFLSGGEKRRLHTAMAMVHRPALLLLDEPTAGVDVATRARLLDVVRGLAGEGTAVCYSTHYLPEVEELDASVTILDGGRVVVRGAVDRLIRAYGETAVEFRLDGELAPDRLPPRAEAHGDVIRMRTTDPAAAVARMATDLSGAPVSIRSIEVVRPSLDTVFLSVTGRRYEENGAARGAPA